MPALSRDQTAQPPVDAPLVLDQVRARVRGEGRRWTPVKSAVVETILDTHRSVGEIQKLVALTYPMVQSSTVRRILNDLTALRLVHALNATGEVRFGLTLPEHHHVVCAPCGRVTTIPFDDLDAALGPARARTGFHLEHISLTLSGICPECCAAGCDPPTE